MAAKLDILRGTLDANNPLAKLRGNEDVWGNVFKRVDDWYEAHIDRESTATIVLDHVAFPEPQDININMMPFTLTKIPEELSPYRSLIWRCPIACRHARKVFYLTIQVKNSSSTMCQTCRLLELGFNLETTLRSQVF
jgi:hypothetical protein